MGTKVTPYNKQGESKKAQVEDMFDNIAGTYDFLNHFLSLGIDNLWRRKAVKWIGESQPKVIMDVATGTGDFAIEAVKLNPKRIVALDLSENMLAVGRKKIKSKSYATLIEFVKGDSEHLDYEDNTFDAMTVGFGVRNFENLEKGLTEMLRVLKPGARLAILEVSQPHRFPMRQIFQLYFHYILPIVGKLFSKDARAYSYLPESVAAFPEGERFVDILHKVGYQEAQWKPLTFGICALYTCKK